MGPYGVAAFDAHGTHLDIDPQGRLEGWPVRELTAGEALKFMETVRTGFELDFDDPQRSKKRRIAWFSLIHSTGHVEVHITSWGRHCNARRTIENVKTFGRFDQPMNIQDIVY